MRRRPARLVDELVRVSVEPALWRERGFVQVVAPVSALAGLDEHDGLLEALAIRAGEDHGRGPGVTRGAAAAVAAHATVVGPVETSTAAASVVET